MEWHELRDALAKDRRISHEKQPEYGYARISIDLGDAEYVGTDIPLAFSGDQLAKIKYTGSDTGTYFRLNNRHAQQIFASEFKRSNIPYTKIYLTNPVAQTGKVFSFYIGTGIFAAIQPGSIGAGNELVGLTNDAGTTINPATEDKQDDIKTLQGVDGAGDLQKVKEELKKLTQSVARTNAWNISSAVYLQNFSVGAQDTAPTDLFFKPDGSKMYVVGDTGNDVNEYDLSTPWDVTSAVFLQLFSVAGQEIAPKGIFFKSDGTKMYVIGDTGDDVNEYDLSTPWDISSAVWLHLFSVAGQETAPTGMYIKPDGTKMYVVGSLNDCVFEYDLDTTLGAPWNVQWADYLQYFSVAGQETNPKAVFFKPDGTKMYVVGSSGDVNEYDLSTPWDVTTAVYLQNFSVAGQELTSQGIFFKPDGTKMYVVGSTGDDVNEYDLRSMNSILTDINNWEDPDFPDHVRSIPPLMDTDVLAVDTDGGTDTITCASGHHLEVFGFIIHAAVSGALSIAAQAKLHLGSKILWINDFNGSVREDIIVMNSFRIAGADNTPLTITNWDWTGGGGSITVTVYYKDITD